MAIRSEARLQQSLDEVTRLLDKHRVLETGAPAGRTEARRDPADGSSVLLTFVTDAMGFFLFLGLASVILF